MKRNLHITLFSFLLCLVFVYASAQTGEALKPLGYNPVLAAKAKETQAKKAQPPTGTGATSTPRPPLHVPFFDDFANYSSVYPNDTLWMDSSVYINNTMAILPPSIGVATFDGLNKWGYPYNINNDSNGLPCDTLTSRPIDLSGEKNDTLRFFLQKGGNGEPPNGIDRAGAADSFVVEFSYLDSVILLDVKGRDSITVQDTFWIQQWDTIGNDTSSPFWLVKVAVTSHGDTNYYRNNFQFRFRSLGNPSGNLDIWNLDYVRLDNLPARNQDVAMYFPAKSLLKNYYSMPWNVFLNAPNTINVDSVSLYIKNNDDTISGRSVFPGYQITDEVSKQVLINYPPVQQVFNMAPDSVRTYSPPDNVKPDILDYTRIKADKNNTAHLLIKTFINAPPDKHSGNDTANITQDFNNYFAYDDGSAELGYGLQNATGGVAVQFNDPSSINYNDSIRAVAFHYNSGENPSDPNQNEKYINIKIWSQINTNGNDASDNKYVLYEWDGQSPHITDTLNGYTIYVLDTPVPVPDSKTFYVGWIQYSPFFLNVGYDANYSLINNDSPNTNVQYDVNGTWQTSGLTGAPMIRPYVSSSPIKYYGIKQVNKNTPGCELYPNPSSSGLFNLRFTNEGKYQLQLYNITGQMIDQQNISGQASSLDYSKFANGLYILRVIDTASGSVVNKRIVISK